MSTTKVLLGSSRRLFADGLAEIIARIPETEVVSMAFNGEEVLEQLQNVDCQIAVLDVQMEILDGYTTARLMKQFYPDVRVILLSDSQSDALSNALKTNVYGYLLKTDRREELDEAIHKAIAGHACYSQVDLPVSYDQSITGRRVKSKKFFFANSLSEELTRREIEIITLVAQGYSSSRIAQMLSISLQTVNTHRRNLIKKIGSKSPTDLTRYALSRGYIK